MPRFAVVSAMVACVILDILVASPRAQVARHLAAPPGDILSGRVVLPVPSELAESSTCAVLELPWRHQAGADGWMAELELPVEQAGPARLALVGIGAAGWSWELAPPAGGLVDVGDWVAAGRARLSLQPTAADADDPRSTVGLELAAASAGTWRLRVRAAGADEPPAAWLALRTAGADAVVLHSYLGTDRRLSDRPLSVVATLAGATVSAAAGDGEFGQVQVESAQGKWRQALWDDGLHDDGAPGDGVLGAWIGPLPPGGARVAVQVQGRVPAGAACVRSAYHAFTVEEPAVVLAGWATTSVLDGQRLGIDVALQPLAALRRLHLSAEVWGADARGEPVPVAWLSTIGQPLETFGTTTLQLQLDGRWLARAGTTGPLELRRLRLQDPDSEVVFDAREALPLPADALPASAFGPPVELTPEMLLGAPGPDVPPPGLPPSGVPAGSPPPGLAPGPTPGPAPGFASGFVFGLPAGPFSGLTGRPALKAPWLRALMLSHGYCSSGPIWPPADFSAPKLVFLDPNANRSNDQFAQLLAAAGAGEDSFGFVGHSQGGLAALHLLTYYASGLDHAIGPRRIQSVASPYQGTPLASLGFFACGVNDDMTPSGAVTWLAGIPTWARNEVSYWTTQNSGAACNFFTNLVLASPNDGTVEKDRGQLPGAHSMGHVTGWCHTTGMTNPASYTDHARNLEMDAQAAR